MRPTSAKQISKYSAHRPVCQMLSTLIPCLYDVPMHDAGRLLGVSPHTIRKCRSGFVPPSQRGWPFDLLRKGQFGQTFQDIQALRDETIARLGPGELADRLERVSELGRLMRTLHSTPELDLNGLDVQPSVEDIAQALFPDSPEPTGPLDIPDDYWNELADIFECLERVEDDSNAGFSAL